jgi:hypothetical protein
MQGVFADRDGAVIIVLLDATSVAFAFQAFILRSREESRTRSAMDSRPEIVWKRRPGRDNGPWESLAAIAWLVPGGFGAIT